ncbi:unnamed protein product [Penicillium olsonii]|nr:unnamed protein product [Penicillium olsonii]
MDLSRGSATPSGPLTLQTTTQRIRVNPDRTALVIIDMQNFFLSPALRPRVGNKTSPGAAAARALQSLAIPAARAQGIQIIWLSWGLTEYDLSTMPPGVMCTFGNYDAKVRDVYHKGANDTALASVPNMIRIKDPALYKSLGTDLGPVELEDKTIIQAGRQLMRGTWNAALYGPLDKEYRANTSDSVIDKAKKPDVLIYKNRTSGLCLPESELEDFLKQRGITTLLFAGVNTDQCVGGTLMDAFSKGYDCILLRDGTATTTGFGASDVWEWNICNCWGFVTTCEALKSASKSDRI